MICAFATIEMLISLSSLLISAIIFLKLFVFVTYVLVTSLTTGRLAILVTIKNCLNIFIPIFNDLLFYILILIFDSVYFLI